MGIEVALIMGAAGAAMSAAGSIQKGKAAKESADYNAATDRQRAAEEKDQAQAQTQDYIRKGSDTVETGIASRGATGVTMEGSPLLVDENTVRQVALGASRTLHGGELRASRLEDDAKLKEKEGKDAVTASYIDAASNLLSSGSKFAQPNFGGGRY